MRLRDFSALEAVIIIAIIVILVIATYGAVLERREWEAFRTDHNCKVVGQTDPTTSVGMAFTGGKNSSIAPVVTTSSGKTGWLCDDGVTYWKNN